MRSVKQSESSRWMTKRYALALTVILLLAGTAYIALTLVIIQQESTGALVNISGRQRMLSQRTTLFVQRMLLSQTPAEYEQARSELEKATDLMELSHNGLTQGNEQLGLPDSMSALVHAMYFEGNAPLDPRMRLYIAALRSVLATPFGHLKADQPEVETILATAPGPLLVSLDKMVWQYQREGEAVIKNLHNMETGVLICTLFTLLLEVFLIFRPMVQQVVNHIERLKEVAAALNQEVAERTQAQQALQQIRDGLEERVKERTAELTREISERKKIECSLRESEQRFRSVAESAVEAIVTIDASGKIITWNKGAEQIFLYPEQEILGKPVETLMPEEFRLRHREGLARMPQGASSRVINATLELRGVRQDGVEFPLELSVSSWLAGGDSFYTGILRDISDRKKSEAALHAAKEQAETATLAKSQFLATMSHEIRTPINALLGMGELLLETTLTDEQRQFLEISNQSGAALLALINDILDLSKIEAGQLDMEFIPFDLHNLLIGTVDILNMLAKEKGNTLSLRCHDVLPQWVQGDPGRLRQILLNLIGNAIKFTQQGSIIVTAQPEPDGSIHFSVTDTGIGIPPDKRESIFLPFNQADSSVTRKFGGTGLGLTICRQVVQHAGGRIGVRSTEGEGSQFYFTLPLPAVEMPPEFPNPTPLPHSSAQGARPDNAVLTLLLVDDAEENQVLVRAYLKQVHCRLDVAGNGAEAVEMVQANSYDLILMDIQMPVMDGFTATRTIRAWEQAHDLPPVPIIALTADAMKEATETAMEAGCTLYLTKPISKRRLLEQLAPFLPL
ncbi:MAG: PAS domain S-box protein [Magnetococcales bacterium]|nr:PAS domain S-box protein [Magnetococcales bacterium]